MKLSATPIAKTLHSIFAAHYKIRQIAPCFKIDKMASLEQDFHAMHFSFLSIFY